MYRQKMSAHLTCRGGGGGRRRGGRRRRDSICCRLYFYAAVVPRALAISGIVGAVVVTLAPLRFQHAVVGANGAAGLRGEVESFAVGIFFTFSFALANIGHSQHRDAPNALPLRVHAIAWAEAARAQARLPGRGGGRGGGGGRRRRDSI